MCGGVIASISKRRQRSIKAAIEKKIQIKLNGITPEEYWEFFVESYEKRNRKISFRKDKFLKLMNAAVEHGACEIRAAYCDEQLVAVNVIFMDEGRAYNQFLTYLPGNGDNAQSFITLDAIESSMKLKRKFDFEGSMMNGVCEYYISWNPELEINYLITKYSRKYIALDFIREILRLWSG